MILNWKSSPLGFHARLELRARPGDSTGVPVTGTVSLKRDPCLFPWILNVRIAADGSYAVHINIHDETGSPVVRPSALQVFIDGVLSDPTGCASYRMEEFERGLDALAQVFEVREVAL